ncbi:MAG: phosphatidate cytidylyltransferase [Verrucomicrobiae bacterium]|nr:phosphatidate cytidylyltransferase [Verrucomicrobiae bacterium]
MSETPEKTPASSAKARAFARRLGSTIALWGFVGFAFWKASPWLFYLMVLLLVLGGLVEYFRLFHEPGRRQYRHLTYGLGFLYITSIFLPVLGFNQAWLRGLDGVALGLLIILIVLTRIWRPLEGIRTLDEIITAVFGFFYIAILFGFVAKILILVEVDAPGNGAGHFYVLYLLAVTKFTDMGAYAIGSLIGKHKMVPHVSPGKTWQGFGGAIFGACVASFGSLALFGEKVPLITGVHAAVLGDLAESILKRSVEIKDSGHKLPGIGGVLDLIDSVLFTAPVMYLYLKMLIFGN